jgi:shikimate kinase
VRLDTPRERSTYSTAGSSRTSCGASSRSSSPVPPGAGKTTTAAALRDALGLPLVAKDALKETLAEQLGTRGRDESRELGVAVFHLMATVVHELLAQGVPLICEGNFVPESVVFRDLPPARIVQVHVSAPPEVLRKRLLERDPHRHPVQTGGAGEAGGRRQVGAVPLGDALFRVGRSRSCGRVVNLVRRR